MTDHLPDQTKLSNKWKELYEEGDIQAIHEKSKISKEDIESYLKTGKSNSLHAFGAIFAYYEQKAKRKINN